MNVSGAAWTVICADAADALKGMENESVDMCVTSPPYFGLRSYGTYGEIGSEECAERYIARLVGIFGEVKRVLKSDGVMWLNIADTWCSSGRRADGCKPKDMIGVPWALAFALRSDGWYLRSDVIWNKTNCLPEPVRDRPTKSYEHVFLLSKSERYYYDADAVAEPIRETTRQRYERGRSAKHKYMGFAGDQAINRPEYFTKKSTEERRTRNRRDVWSIATNSCRVENHFAMFPEELARICILSGSRKGGVVLDPFCGSGTAGAVAVRTGRRFVGIELNGAYCETARRRIGKEDGITDVYKKR